MRGALDGKAWQATGTVATGNDFLSLEKDVPEESQKPIIDTLEDAGHGRLWRRREVKC